jgi:hypothetical protein
MMVLFLKLISVRDGHSEYSLALGAKTLRHSPLHVVGKQNV